MLNVKRPISSKSSTSQIDEWENDIKNSIKTLYLQNQNGTKLISQYENALQTLKQEYALVYKENEERKKIIEEMNSQQKFSSEKRQKRPLSRLDYEKEYDEDENVKYIVRKKKKIPKKIIYEEEEEETDSENDEIENEQKIEEKRKRKPNKKGISKSIKM